MNLSLRTLGKKKCEDIKIFTLKVLSDLLEHENRQVRTFVNGTLYSLLSRQVMKEQARAMGLNEILRFLMKQSEEVFTKQISYMLEQLAKENDDAESVSDQEVASAD